MSWTKLYNIWWRFVFYFLLGTEWAQPAGNGVPQSQQRKVQNISQHCELPQYGAVLRHNGCRCFKNGFWDGEAYYLEILCSVSK